MSKILHHVAEGFFPRGQGEISDMTCRGKSSLAEDKAQWCTQAEQGVSRESFTWNDTIAGSGKTDYYHSNTGAAFSIENMHSSPMMSSDGSATVRAYHDNNETKLSLVEVGAGALKAVDSTTLHPDSRASFIPNVVGFSMNFTADAVNSVSEYECAWPYTASLVYAKVDRTSVSKVIVPCAYKEIGFGPEQYQRVVKSNQYMFWKVREEVFKKVQSEKLLWCGVLFTIWHQAATKGYGVETVCKIKNFKPVISKNFRYQDVKLKRLCVNNPSAMTAGKLLEHPNRVYFV